MNDLAEQSADPKQFEVLVINNNSTDSTAEVCMEFQAAHLEINFKAVIEKKQGLSHARNRAVAEAKSEYILYIDDDVRLPSDFVAAALNYLEKYPKVKCAGGRIYVSFDGMEKEPDWIPSELMPMFGLHDPSDKDMLYPKSNFPRGGNMMIRKEVFQTHGLFETDLGRTGKELLGSEEKHFFGKVRKGGVSLNYWADLRLWHRIGPERLTPGYLKRQSEGIGKSERLRVQGNPAAFLAKLLSELVKLAGSFVLAAGYLLRGRSKAAGFLIRFRIWVIRGFLTQGN
jgi:glucosyl-dolichyl phosphate glucuronosyltransferase